MRRGSEIKFRFQFDRSHKGHQRAAETLAIRLMSASIAATASVTAVRAAIKARMATERPPIPSLASKSFVDEDGGEREGHFRATDTPWAPWHVIRRNLNGPAS